MWPATVYYNYILSQLTEGERSQAANGRTMASLCLTRVISIVPLVNMAACRGRGRTAE